MKSVKRYATFGDFYPFYLSENRPATFTYPLYSFMGDWVMWRDILARKIKL